VIGEERKDLMEMVARLQNKVAVVTGGASGIGRGIAEAFHHEGAKVVIGDISGSEDVVAKELGDHAHGVRCDVTRSADLDELMETARDRFGRLDIVVNSAGIAGVAALTGDVNEDDFDRMIDVGLKGVFLSIRAALPLLLEANGGSIINIASTAALAALPSRSAYCAAKGGVVALSRCTALEYATANIRVNAICPGIVDTPLLRGAAGPHVEAALAAAAAATPVNRVGVPGDIAPLAVFLASDESAFVTGAALTVDGGFTAGPPMDNQDVPWRR
jgi:NAD(P)-dependent dehydrogenase (short-subunit alcohol dehydrogenase family)